MGVSLIHASSQYISLASHTSGLKTPNGWMAFWWKSTTAQDNIMFSIGKSGSETARISIGTSTATWPDESITFQNYSSGNNIYCAVRKGHNYLIDNLWHHVILKFDGNNAIIIDGVPETVVYDVGGSTSANFFLTTPNADDCRIGRGVWSGNGTTAIINDLRIYDSILTIPVITEKAKTIFKSDGNDGETTGLKARYMMNEKGEGETVATITDLSGNGYDGTAVNSPTYLATKDKIFRGS
jgi:hypothetical protein